MQGQRNSMGPLPENLFGDGSVSGDSLLGPQIPWNNNHNDSGTHEQHRATGHTLPSSHSSAHFLQHSGLYDPNPEWVFGESSSNASQNQANIGVRKPEDSWNFSSSGVLSFENRQYEPSNSTPLSLDNNPELNSNRNPTFTLMGLPFPPNRNTNLGFGNNSSCPEVENRGKSQKRKAIDFSMGQSSNSSIEMSQWQSPSDNTNTSLRTENGDSSTLRQRLFIGDQESSRGLRVENGFAHQLPQLSTYSDVRNVVRLPPNGSSGLVRDCFLDSNPTTERMQPASFLLPNVHRNLSLPSIRRLGNSSLSSSSYCPVSEERGPQVLEASSSRNILEPSVLLSSVGTGNTSQNPGFLSSSGGNLASSSQASSSTNQLNLMHTHRARRLSDVIRRPLLGSPRIEPGSQNGPRSSPSGLDGLSQRARSVLLERRPNATLGLPRSLRTFGAAASAGEAISNSMPEHVRRILDIMRRGEGLRFEDMMILDHPAFYAMADVHDRHRDMRMDVDNMSYEELLALEERIGNVCTGLSEESIMKHMKQHKFAFDCNQEEPEPCSICREEYNEGEDIGKLECGHDFHRDCIKQWLKNKNLCPICKTTGLSTT